MSGLRVSRSAAELSKAIAARIEGRVAWDRGARELWHAEYANLSAGRPGLHGVVTARAAVGPDRSRGGHAGLQLVRLEPFVEEGRAAHRHRLDQERLLGDPCGAVGGSAPTR